MYCMRCSEERGPRTQFCVACGDPLAARPREALQRDLGQNLFLVDALERWEKRGELTAKFVTRLAEPYRSRIQRLEAALEALGRGDAIRSEEDLPRVVRPTPAPAPRVDSSSAGAVVAQPMPHPQAFIPPPVNVVVAPQAPAPMRAADDAIALASGALEGPLSLADVEAPPPAPLERIVERESSWGAVWRPFLYDNAIWFVGAFCIVSGSLYVASQAYGHVGDVARSLIVMGMMLAYAGGFGAAGFWLDARKGLRSAGRILSLIGASVAPVALTTIEPLRASSPVAFVLCALGSLAAAALLLRTATDRFDPRLSRRVALAGVGLMAWLLLVPRASGEPGLAVAIPLGVLLCATPVLRRRDPEVERPAQAFAALMLLYLAAFDLARLHVLLHPAPGLALYGPVAAALGWIALRADGARLRIDADAPPRLEPTSLAALALVVCGGLCALVAESSAAAATMLATLAFADAARSYRRAPFVAVASALGLFAYDLSPDLIPHGVALVVATAKRALGYPESQPLPFAYAGISTLPYLVLLGVLARRAHARGQRWIARPLGFTGAALAVLLTLVSHASSEARPGLWSSLALVALAGAGLWLAEHAAAGYLFGYVVALLGFDVARTLGAGPAGLALGLAASAMLLLAVARVAPERQRAGLVGEALVLAFLVPLVAVTGRGTTPAPLALAAGAGLFVLLALQTRSRLPAFLGAATLALAGDAWLALPSSHGLAAPLLLGGALLAMLAAGLARTPPEESSPGVRPFGMALPWPTQGLDLFRDPLALLAAGLATVIVAPVVLALPTAPLATGRIALAAAAVVALLLARRYAVGHVVFVAVALATLACLGQAPALALLGLACALVAVAFTTWPNLARAALRTEGEPATLAFALAATLLPLGVLALDARPWLAASALSMVLLLRWKPVPALWLSLAFLCAWWAGSSEAGPATAHTSSALVLALAALGLLAHERARWVAVVLGVEGEDVAPVLIWLVPCGTLLALGELCLHGRSGLPAHAVVPLALWACAFLLLARQTEHPVPLFIGAACGFGAAACQLPAHQVGIELGGAVAVALLANGVRLTRGLAEAAFGVFPAKRAGDAFGLLGLGLVLMPLGSAVLFDVSLAPVTHAYPLLAAAVVFLCARALGWAPLHPLALGLALADLLVRSGLHQTHALPFAVAGAGALLLALAICTRRFPALLTRIFLDRPPEQGRADTLRHALLTAMVGAALAAPALAGGLFSSGLVVGAAELSALLLALAPLAAPGAGWWVASAVVALGGSLASRSDGSFLPTFLAANVLLGLAGLVQRRAVQRGLRRALGATHPAGDAPRSVRAYARACTAVVAAALLLGAASFLGTLVERIDARREIVDAARTVSLLLPLTGLHLLLRRRSPRTLLLALTLPLLAVGYLAPPPLLPVWLALAALPDALLAWLLPMKQVGRGLVRAGLGLHARRRTQTANLAFLFVVGLALAALAATQGDLSAWQTPFTAGVLTAALVVASLRQKVGRLFALALLPATAHLALAWLGIQLSTGRPHASILGAWALAAAALALGAEVLAGEREDRGDLRVAAHLYFALGVVELGAALALMPGMHPSELLCAGLAAALLGGFALRRALRTGQEVYAYLAQGALVALYLLVRLQTEFVGHRGDRDALSTVVLGFAFLGLHALARRVHSAAFERPTRVVTHVLPLLGLLFVPQLTAAQGAFYGLGLALHFAAVSGATGGSKLSATLSAVALNAALAVTWIDRGIADPQFYAIPFGATLLAFARIFKRELSERARFGLRTAGILSVYVASATSALYFASAGYVLVCAVVCVLGVLLGVSLRVKSYVYLGSAFLVVDVLGNMARYGLRQPFLGGLFLTLLGFVLVGGWIVFVSKREELVRRYEAFQSLVSDWE